MNQTSFNVWIEGTTTFRCTLEIVLLLTFNPNIEVLHVRTETQHCVYLYILYINIKK